VASAVRETFGSRFAFIAAAIGMAVGTGNIWRFPRVAGEWGGGTFLIALVVANLVWAIPILMGESLMGSKSRLGTVGAFREFMGRKFAWMGAYMGLITIGILFYYSVVCGWAIRYAVYSLTGTLDPGLDTQALWDDFTGDPAQTILFHFIAIACVGVIVYRGLKGGFETVLKFVIPALFVLLVILAIRAVTLSGASEGLRYLFVPDWSRMGNAQVWLQAFSQMAFSTGAGWGLYLTYAVYMRHREDFGLNASTVVAGNLLASLLAGVIVLCTIFALRPVTFAEEALAAGNQGLAFIYFTELLVEMPGGAVFAPLFYLALALAGVSSLIAMLELATRNVMDMGLSRHRSVPLVVVVTFVAGIPAALSVDYLSNQDFVWGVGLLIGGLLAAIAMMKYGVERARAELDAVSDFRIGAWWSWLIRIFPLLFAVLIGWWMYQAVSDFAPDTWWNPFETFSLATMLLQWAVLFAIVYALNGFFANRVRRGEPAVEDPPDGA
jgi:neurotransmitter:Na+ symporter, NSS family